MAESLWVNRWESWTDEELTHAIDDENPMRYRRYAATILKHLTPKVTLDIGGGTGGFGAFLPGQYIVMDHPRMEKFCKAPFIPIGPIGEVTPKPDLVVNTNSWGETTLAIVADYIQQIEAAEIPYLYSNNRMVRQVSFREYPLDNWKPLVIRVFSVPAPFVEFLGQLR